MTETLVNFLLSLSRRERLLLGLMAGVALPLAVLFLVILPLATAQRNAAADLKDAELTRRWVLDRAAEARALGPVTGPEQTTITPIGISGIEQSLIANGIRPLATRLSNRDRAGIELGFDAIQFETLAAWMGAEITVSGYRIATFRFEAGDDPGIVSADIVLDPAQ